VAAQFKSLNVFSVFIHFIYRPNDNFGQFDCAVTRCEIFAIRTVCQTLERSASLILEELFLPAGFDSIYDNECPRYVSNVAIARIHCHGSMG
jgi:hypothetical protein